jgi:hypothetical protein
MAVTFAPFVVVVFYLTTNFAFALQPPTDADLKTAYCITVTQSVITNAQEVLRQASPHVNDLDPGIRQVAASTIANANESITLANDRLNRLQLYLMPRLQYLDTLALLAAMKRGETDSTKMYEMSSQLMNRCASECTGPNVIGEAQDNSIKCATDCVVKDEVVARVRSCLSITWIPF